MTDYRIISADGHLEVNPQLWQDYIPQKYRPLGPKLVDNPGVGGGKAWMVEGGANVIPLGLAMCGGLRFDQFKPSGWTYEDNARGTGDAKQRLAEMDQDGIDAEVLYPGVFGPKLLTQIKDREAQRGIVSAYNRFVNDFCSEAPHRFIGIGILPETGVDDASAELEHIAGLRHLRGVYPTNWPAGKEYPTPEDDRFWAAIQETGLPVSAHVNFGAGPMAHPMMQDGQPVPGGGVIGRMSVSCPPPSGTVSQLIAHGVFDRFPKLQFVFAETGAGWIAYWLEQMDDRYMRHRHYSGIKVKHLPSDYFRRHVAVSFQIDRTALENVERIGSDNLMWANDFPHAEGDWPNSRRVVQEQFSGVEPHVRDKILAGNAARIYKLDA
ncbi:MAG: amidohydrolase [Caulobacteraceae bacterium]|nr:amidohydrolase [Caulobacteraceae bacterium]